MSTQQHPLAPHQTPFFLPGADGSDPLLAGTAIFLIVAVVAFGLLFLRIHTLPERMAHQGHKLQFEIVAVLGLLALFTHVHAFWVAGLLLALIDIPDFVGPMRRIAGAAERIAGLPPGAGDALDERKLTLNPAEGIVTPRQAEPDPVQEPGRPHSASAKPDKA